jgi:trans-aconitate 2-methyltransferase
VPTWDPEQYLRFERERSIPCRELISRLDGLTPERIIDLGCGTGTSTAQLRKGWPHAHLYGLDSSAEMIASARQGDPGVVWTLGDIRTWSTPQPFDLVFSNAALHWIPDHATAFPRLLHQVRPGGALAVQMPTNFEAPAHRCIREVASSSEWTAKLGAGLLAARVETPEFYYRLLSPLAPQIDIWQTEYVHVLPDAAAIVEWLKGSTLRPYLDLLGAHALRDAFLAQLAHLMKAAYPAQPDGRVLFPFRRLFVIARR